MRKIIFLAGGIVYVICFSFLGYDQEARRDPFASLLPRKTPVADNSPPSVERVITPPTVNIQGLLCGTNMPMAIIDGEVYKEGDILDKSGAKLYKIEKNKICIIYQGKPFDVIMEQ